MYGTYIPRAKVACFATCCGKWILHGKNSPNTNTTKFAINFDGKLDSFGIKRDCLLREGIFGAN